MEQIEAQEHSSNASRYSGILLTALGGLCFSRLIEPVRSALMRPIDWGFLSFTGEKAVFTWIYLLYLFLLPAGLGILFSVLGYKRMARAGRKRFDYLLVLIGALSLSFLIGTIFFYAFLNRFMGVLTLIFY